MLLKHWPRTNMYPWQQCAETEWILARFHHLQPLNVLSVSPTNYFILKFLSLSWIISLISYQKFDQVKVLELGFFCLFYCLVYLFICQLWFTSFYFKYNNSKGPRSKTIYLLLLRSFDIYIRLLLSRQIIKGKQDNYWEMVCSPF